MRKFAILVAVLVCSFTVFSQQRTVSKYDNAQVLPIHRVILYSNGVAYIERRGMVSGDAEINLTFKQTQVDDVLKSMIVLDLGEGVIGAVSYNSSEPFSSKTSEIPFSVESNSDGGIYKVLSQLQGAKVTVSSTKGTLTGAILTVEKRSVPQKEDSNAIKQFLVIASDVGEISSFDLSEIRSVNLLDDETRKNLKEFAEATATARRRDAKTITVTSEGIGQREMIVSYTIAAPIWKTTYRVVLDKQGKPFFQGWAIVDNVSDEDWQDVKLSLVSGSPVSFIQNLQKPLYRYRPIVPIPDDLELEPQIYDPSIRNESGSGSGRGSGNGTGSGSGSGVGYGSGASQPQAVTTSMSEALMNETAGVQTAAIGSQFGDLFKYEIAQPVSVPRNRSALIPIIQTKMEGERVSIFRFEENDFDYQDEETTPRPMSGLLLKNTTPLTFEGGSLTVIDGDAYAGEALMERLKPKEDRLISFALDLGTLINVMIEKDRQPAKLIKAAEGSFEVHYFKTDEKVYQLQNQTDRLKYVYIEHPIRKDWKLDEKGEKPVEVTQKFYRFRVELPAFARKDLVVTEVQGLKDSYRLSMLTRDNLELFIKQRYVDENTLARLVKLIDLRAEISRIEKTLNSLDAEITEIAADQNRLRENIKVLANTSEAKKLIERYVQKADEQETRLEQIKKERIDLHVKRVNLERQLAIEIKNFEIIGK